jgi:hypothetical protein
MKPSQFATCVGSVLLLCTLYSFTHRKSRFEKSICEWQGSAVPNGQLLKLIRHKHHTILVMGMEHPVGLAWLLSCWDANTATDGFQLWDPLM